MRRTVTLTITSLLTVLLLTVHLAQDSVHVKDGTSRAGIGYLVAMALLALVAYGALALADRRSGRVLMLIGAVVGLGMPLLHVRGLAGIRPDLFFVWTLLALAVIPLVTLLLLLDTVRRRER